MQVIRKAKAWVIPYLVSEPEVALLPFHESEARQLVTLLAVQFTVVCPKYRTRSGTAAIATAGCKTFGSIAVLGTTSVAISAAPGLCLSLTSTLSFKPTRPIEGKLATTTGAGCGSSESAPPVKYLKTAAGSVVVLRID